MPNSEPTRKSKLLLLGAGLAGICLFVFFLPLFHIVPLKQAQADAAAAKFDPVAYVEEFWSEKLLTEADSAVDASELLAAFETDPVAAAERYGHKLGLSGTASYFVSGTGKIVAAEDGKIEIALQDGGNAAVIIKTGPVFGNAIRDGSGLLDVSQFPNSTEFNDISSEINRRVEEKVFPLLKEKAVVGTTVRFAGGVDIADSETEFAPLKLVPVLIEFP